jgi:glutathione S-transferase
MKLYHDPITVNCRKVAAGFALMSVGFEKSHVNYLGGGHKAAEYLEINPNGFLPTLVDGDFKLWESNAILQYAAEKTEAFVYYPRELKKRADIHRWQFWEAAHWYPSCYVYLVENLVKPMMNTEPDQAAIDKDGAELAQAGKRSRTTAHRSGLDLWRQCDACGYRRRRANASLPLSEASAPHLSEHPALDDGTRRGIAVLEGDGRGTGARPESGLRPPADERGPLF